MNPSHAVFFWKTCRQKLFSPTHPPRHPTSCLTGCDAKVPRATALHRLGFQCFRRSHRDGYWLPGPCWGQKKRMTHIFIPFLCLFVWIEIRQSNCWDHLTSDDLFVDTEKKMGGSKEYARAKEEQEHVPI